MDRIRENKKVVMMGAGGIIAVLLAVFLVLPSGGSKNTPVEEVTAVYSLVELAEGDVITEEMVEVRELEDEDSEVDSFKNVEDVIGSEVLKSIGDGRIVEHDSVKAPHIEDYAMDDGHMAMGSNLSSMVPDGLRAVLMPTGDVQEMVKFLSVGNRIDLVITHKTGEGFETTTPFKNVEVLMIDESSNNSYAVSGDASEDPDAPEVERATMGGASVILAMSPEQAETILNMRLSGVLETVQITLIGDEVPEVE